MATEEGKELEKFLKDRAWEADSEGETRVYLVKDENGSVVLFFSLKCGLLYKKYQYDELEEDKREFVNLLIEAIQQKDDVREMICPDVLQEIRAKGYFAIR